MSCRLTLGFVLFTMIAATVMPSSVQAQFGELRPGFSGVCRIQESNGFGTVIVRVCNGIQRGLTLTGVTPSPLIVDSSDSASLIVDTLPSARGELVNGNCVSFQWSVELAGCGVLSISDEVTAEDPDGVTVTTGVIPCGSVVAECPTSTPTRTPIELPTLRPTRTPVPPEPTRTRPPAFTPRPTRTPFPTFALRATRTPRPPEPTFTTRPTRTPITPEPTSTSPPTRTPFPTLVPRPTRTPVTPAPTRTRPPTFTPQPTRTPFPTFTSRPTRTPIPPATATPTREIFLDQITAQCIVEQSGDRVSVRLSVRNLVNADIVSFVPGSLNVRALGGNPQFNLLTGPSPRSYSVVRNNTTVVFQWTGDIDGFGVLGFSTSASGQVANPGETVSTGIVQCGTAEIVEPPPPPFCAECLEAECVIIPAQGFIATVMFTVINETGGDLTDVTPLPIELTPRGDVFLRRVIGPRPGLMSLLPAGRSDEFRWQIEPTGNGQLFTHITVVATGPNGEPVTTGRFQCPVLNVPPRIVR